MLCNQLINVFMTLFSYFPLQIICVQQDQSAHWKKSNNLTTENIFKATLMQSRLQRKEAIQRVLQFQNYEKQYQITDQALKKIFEIVADGKVIVENSHYIPGAAFPSNVTVVAALRHVLDNTAMFGDFQLKLPDITDRIMNNHPNWLVLMKWAIGFSNSTGIYDKKTTQMIDLLCQEMNLIERKDNFFNPYRKYDVEVNKESTSSTPKPKKNSFRKGPRMTKPKQTEL